ncbi:hypothetical protein SK128_013262 [Halocaridina rubra]|uniref:Uncharacterized protein n=1 Tax=Halocaridina rubra TaxID=373956 RepID=A0AAN8XIN5_HALRR
MCVRRIGKRDVQGIKESIESILTEYLGEKDIEVYISWLIKNRKAPRRKPKFFLNNERFRSGIPRQLCWSLRMEVPYSGCLTCL